MREHLDMLSNEQSMFLLTLMMLEGEEDLELIRYLPEEQAHTISQVGQVIASEPRKQMLPQIVREIKALVKASQRSPIEHFEPEWMAEFLKHESPRVISALLQPYPRSTIDRVIMALPGHLRQSIPQSQHQLHPEIARYIKQKFDAKCPTHFNPSKVQSQVLDLSSIAQLEAEEILRVTRELGLRELAAAFRSAGRGALTELCRVLNPTDAERLLHIIRTFETVAGSPEAKEEMKSATRVLQTATKRNRSASKSQLVDDAGFAKLREASFELPEEQQQAIAFKLPHKQGKRFKESQSMQLGPHDTFRIQCETLQVIQLLSQEGKLNQKWSEVQIEYPPPPPEA